MQMRQKINYRKTSISVTTNKIYFKNHFKTWSKVFLLHGSGNFFFKRTEFLFSNIFAYIDPKIIQVANLLVTQ